MQIKHLIWILSGIAGVIVLLALITFGIYYLMPGVFGIESEEIQSQEIEYISLDTVPLIPTVRISEERLNQLQRGITQKMKLREEKDSLRQYTMRLGDSIASMESNIKAILDTMRKNKEDLAFWRDSTNSVADSLTKLYSRLEKALAKIKRNDELLTDQESFISKKQDSLEMRNFETYAKIYNNANPQDVANILALIDERDASKILKIMSKKQAGKVLESMEPNRAAAIMLLGTN